MGKFKPAKYKYDDDDCQRARLDAEYILEKLMHRSNYTSRTRDELSEYLTGVVLREQQINSKRMTRA